LSGCADPTRLDSKRENSNIHQKQVVEKINFAYSIGNIFLCKLNRICKLFKKSTFSVSRCLAQYRWKNMDVLIHSYHQEIIITLEHPYFALTKLK
jgi:hypothetical protein